MIVDATTRVLFDASCMIAAAASPAGGSGFVWTVRARGYLVAVISAPILAETEANLTRKFPEHCLEQHRGQLRQGHPLLTAVPHLDVVPRRYPQVNEKDEHVIAAAVACGCTLVLTLDRGLADEINGSGIEVQAVSPKQFITELLPSHPAFPHMRDGES